MKAAVRAWSSIAVLLGASLAAQAGCGTRLSLPAEGGATQAYTLASDERLAEASTASLAIVAVGLLPLIFLSRGRNSSRTARNASGPASTTKY